MSRVIYFDHAATSWPKPPVVSDALDRYFGTGGGNPGRSGHRMSIEAASIVEDCRDALAECFNVDDPARIVFTKNATEALNVAINGILAPGDHVVTSSIEHNSVMRPLRHLESHGVDVTVIPCESDGILDAQRVKDAITPATRLIVTLHGSNVMGSLLPVEEIAAIARDRSIPYLVDTSQTAGAVPIDVAALGIDLLAFTGHKSLLGPTGTGGLYVGDGLDLEPLLRGGTGSRSDLEEQPDFMPDALESGTLNVAGLAGLGAAVRYLLGVGIGTVATHERSLMDRFVRGASGIPGITLYGPAASALRCGVVAFNVAEMVCSDVGTLLDREYGIMSRVGLHCAPGAHRTIGTFPTGTVRFGFGFSNTEEEIDVAVEALTDISAWATDRASAL